MSCKPDQHFDRVVKGKPGSVKCQTCGDVYPCKEDCLHADCRMDKGQPLPPWVSSPGYRPTQDLWCPACYATIVPGKPHDCG